MERNNAKIRMSANIRLKIRNMRDFKIWIYCPIMALHKIPANMKKCQENTSQNHQKYRPRSTPPIPMAKSPTTTIDNRTANKPKAHTLKQINSTTP